LFQVVTVIYTQTGFARSCASAVPYIYIPSFLTPEFPLTRNIDKKSCTRSSGRASIYTRATFTLGSQNGRVTPYIRPLPVYVPVRIYRTYTKRSSRRTLSNVVRRIYGRFVVLIVDRFIRRRRRRGLRERPAEHNIGRIYRRKIINTVGARTRRKR